MSHFQRYAAFYDLLYRDKNYEAEARYVARKLREVRPDARSILELGSGTGRHGRLLASMDFDVHGIEASPEMVAVAQSSDVACTSGLFTCEVGDICKVDLGRSFDCIIALFHVISYQTSDAALQAAFATATKHLAPGGVFLFDVWHGPAVLTQGASKRVKEVEDDLHWVRRIASPTVDTHQRTVKVVYDMECRDKRSGEVTRFSEDHLMRYVFPTDVNQIGRACGFEVVSTEEFLTGETPSEKTWGVSYMLRRVEDGA
jgi:SAM-dependent methyltransferase